jgi:hypothetical protein
VVACAAGADADVVGESVDHAHPEPLAVVPERAVEERPMQLPGEVVELLWSVHRVAAVGRVVDPELVIEREPVLERAAVVEHIAHAELAKEEHRWLHQRLAHVGALLALGWRTEHHHVEIGLLELDPGGDHQSADAGPDDEKITDDRFHSGSS